MNMQRLDVLEQVEALITQYQRREARYRRLFSYKLRRIRENDPTLTKVGVVLEDVIPTLLYALQKNNKVERLEIACITLAAPGRIGQLLLVNSTIASLKLSYCTIPTKGAAAIFRCLTNNSTLKDLDLSHSEQLFDLNDNTTAIAQAFSDTLPHMKSLRSLNLCDTGLSGPVVKSIFQGLQNNTTLESLNLSENPGIAPELHDSLIQYLPHLKGLHTLSVQSTGLSDYLDQRPDLMASLADAMSKNMLLWKLDHIVLHRADYYTEEKKRFKQKQCFGYLQQIEFYKIRNGLFSSRLLTMNQRALWPWILERAGSNSTFPTDLIFFCLKEKCDTVIQKEQVQVVVTTNGRAQKQGTKRLRLSASRSQAKNKRRKKSFKQQTTTTGHQSGFFCSIHNRSTMLPSNCCSFERVQPLETDSSKSS